MRLIDVDVLSEKFIKECAEECAICPMCDGRYFNNPKLLHCKIIIDAPIIDRPQGEWIREDDYHRCSNCHCVAPLDGEEYWLRDKIREDLTEICPNCGCWMSSKLKTLSGVSLT